MASHSSLSSAGLQSAARGSPQPVPVVCLRGLSPCHLPLSTHNRWQKWKAHSSCLILPPPPRSTNGAPCVELPNKCCLLPTGAPKAASEPNGTVSKPGLWPDKPGPHLNSTLTSCVVLDKALTFVLVASSAKWEGRKHIYPFRRVKRIFKR